MVSQDKLNKELLVVVNSMKDSVATNLVKATQSGMLNVEKNQLEKIILLVSQTLDASFHKSNKIFMRSVSDLLVKS